ncbi:hypothetical protein [Ohtaekwangia koreensis]|uniref:Peptidase propeptide and YPEB domain-containing protein n=1 Tax=Ohtaekwangia koreensis TaxID=688867 RepID=A0A1T5JJL8_9BACT|nr:hypothetical protein [Ohtaekwangia koreensis]SKC51574.1 hypothetical protein SAMN05660236_1168 [Ohtaekwangia koreensis]
MKKVLFVFALVAGIGAANAQVSSEPAPAAATESTQLQGDKVKIKAEELPQTVKKELEGEDYRGWLINAAYHDKTKNTYEVELKNGAETKTVKFDKEGKKVD